MGQHSSKTTDWGTSANLVAFIRRVIGEIDVDPCSSPKWNEVIRAKRIITKQQNGTKTSWVAGAPVPGKLRAQRRLARANVCTALVNAPGEKSGELVALFWRALAGYFELGWISSAVWVGFSVEQLARLQRVSAASHPLEHVTLIPAKRQRYQSKPGVAGKQPGHASFLTLLTRSRSEVDRFIELGCELGYVVRGDRWR